MKKNERLTIGARLTAIWRSPWTVPALAGLFSAIIFSLTLQTHINGSNHAYAKDVGELQNALPRWGTIHFSGYPLYSITGSLIVTLLRLIGIPPAPGASLVSLLWGALSVAILARLALELGAKRPAALVGVMLFPVATSMWIDASLAEVHTMTVLFVALTLYLAIRFHRSGDRRLLIWLAAVFGQGIFHGRSVVGLLPAVALLAIPRWRRIWRNAPLLVGLGLLLPPLLYLYLPLREWMGSTWTFGNTSTWEGFWRMFLNIKAARFAEIDREMVGWLERLTVTLRLLRHDLPLALHGAGLLGLFTVTEPGRDRWRIIAALVLALLPYLLAPVIIYAGFIGDAILAVKLPVSMFTGLGTALLISRLRGWRPEAGTLALGLTIAAIAFSGWRNYPDVIEITRDRSVEDVIAIADQTARPDRPTVLMVPWGRDYWGVAYARAYRGQLEGVDLVDHNAPFQEIVARGDRLLTLSETFYVYPIGWWKRKLGPVTLEATVPEVIEIRTQPRMVSGDEQRFRVNQDLSIASARVERRGEDYLVRVDWVAEGTPRRDYSTAVHLVSWVPARGAQDVLAQADARHPVEGWYPTTRWAAGQVVQDVYRLTSSSEREPIAVRVTAYYVDESGGFVNGEWLTLTLDESKE
ncbi:MAG: DUF2723 domain-containing protein [Anaerolineae bacterium]|jgi:hypothetical protein